MSSASAETGRIPAIRTRHSRILRTFLNFFMEKVPPLYCAAKGRDLDTAVDAANSGDTIYLLANCETAGLNLSKNLTIDGGEDKFTVTFEGAGIALWGKALTFQNCHVVMTGIGSTPDKVNGWTWQTICASKDASLTLNNTTMEMDGTGVASGTHAIYFCSNNKLNLTDSSLTIRNYPQDALEWDGGDGGYNVNLVKSTFISDHNRSGFTGTFVTTATNSNIDVIYSTGNGSNGSHFVFENANVNFNNNGSHGLSAATLTINNSTVNANNNGMCGIISSGKTEIQSSEVTIEKNKVNVAIDGRYARPGAFTISAETTVSADSTVSICDNGGSGIFLWGPNASLDMKAGTIMRNTANNSGYGGGIYNEGSVTLAPSVVLYNNHAATAGDDIYHSSISYRYDSKKKENVGTSVTPSITFGDVGSDWVLDDCNDSIDGWYEDGAEDDPGLRWNVHDETKEQHIVEKASGRYTGALALKAAHGESIIPAFGIPILWLNMEDHYSYIIGYPDGTVQPNGKITRAEVATIFFRLLSDDTREAFWSSTNDYSDVPADKWYNNAVSTLSRLGVISGYPDGTFRPDASITRAEFAKIAVSFCKYGSTTYSGCFSDVKASDWFSTCVETARNSNLIAGYPDGTFRPNNAITRAEACTIVNRTLGRKPAKNHMAISGRINWPDCLDTEWFYADMMEATNSHDYQMVGLVEDWNRKLPQRDWAALETEWSHAYSAPGGEVGR